jgi:hypothetical protein
VGAAVSGAVGVAVDVGVAAGGDELGLGFGVAEAPPVAVGVGVGVATGVRTGVGRPVGTRVALADGLSDGWTGGTTSWKSMRKSKLGSDEDQSGDTEMSTLPYWVRRDRASSSDLPRTSDRSLPASMTGTCAAWTVTGTTISELWMAVPPTLVRSELSTSE